MSAEVENTEKEKNIYLEAEVNLLKPYTPYMRDNLRIIWTIIIIWVFTTFGFPIIVWLTAWDPLGEGPLTAANYMGWPVHWFLTALIAPTSALVLCIIFCIRLDQLNRKYGRE